jgi:superfamily II DNA or RNA helicase
LLARRILESSGTWGDLKRALAPLGAKEKGDCFEALVEHYLRISPVYTSVLKHVWHLRDVPPDKRKRLNLPGPDEGIDLVAETVDGGFWAIQCKYKEDEEHSLTRRELSTFTDLAFGICRGIELGLVCTTADRFSHKLKLYGDRLSFCAGDIWRGLDASFFTRLHRAIAGAAPKPRQKVPRPHQRSVIAAAGRHYLTEGNTRGKLLMPCGTGKSLAAYWVAEKLGARSILVAVPSLALVRQTLDVWATEAAAHGRAMHWMAVCSDESVGEFDRDDPVLLTQDLGVKVHTNPREIAPWLAQRWRGTKVVFTTYQSGPAVATAARKAKFAFDLGILDEAHKTVGERGALFGHLLDDRNVRIARRVFMTATERRYRGGSDRIASMDDPAVYGETFEQLSFKKAIEAKPPILSDYRIVTVFVTRREIADLVRKNLLVKPDKGRWDREVEAATLAAAVALRRAMERHGMRHAVSFHGSVARARAFQACQDALTRAFPQLDSLKVFHVSGKTPTAVRSRELDAFASARRSLVTNARCLTEGVDVPGIDCVLFADPRRSTVDIVQAVGRALRIAPGKRMGYVVVPVLLDEKGTPDDVTQGNAFKDILTVLRALAANDERIVEYFRTVSQGRRLPQGKTQFQIDLPLGVKIDAAKFAESIELRCWDRLARLAWRPFEEARVFATALGLQNVQEWFRYCRGRRGGKSILPSDIPTDPGKVYAGRGWKDWGDWLGTQRRKGGMRSFEDARRYTSGLNLERQSDWRNYCRHLLPGVEAKPPDIPANPKTVYQGEWKSWSDWLGIDERPSWRSYLEARKFVRSLSLPHNKAWRRYIRGKLEDKPPLPRNVPRSPDLVYKGDGWTSWGEFLGTPNVFKPKYRSFKAARRFARALGLRSLEEWKKFTHGQLRGKPKRPADIPMSPDNRYRTEGWRSWPDWLGTERRWLPFSEARQYARGRGLKSREEWVAHLRRSRADNTRKESDLPLVPDQIYMRNGWNGWNDFLGTKRRAPGKKESFRSFDDARRYVKTLGLANAQEWREWSAGRMRAKGRRPSDIPSSPASHYRHSGWQGWGDWLGTGNVWAGARTPMPFKAARNYVRSLGLGSQREWYLWIRGKMPEKGSAPDDMPSNVSSVYKKLGWVNWADWLGKTSPDLK